MSAANAIGNALAGYPNNKTDNGTFFGKYALIIDHGIGMMSSFSRAIIVFSRVVHQEQPTNQKRIETSRGDNARDMSKHMSGQCQDLRQTVRPLGGPKLHRTAMSVVGGKQGETGETPSTMSPVRWLLDQSDDKQSPGTKVHVCVQRSVSNGIIGRQNV